MQHPNLNTEQAKQRVIVSLKADTPVMLYGSPGIGKSAIVQQIAEECEMQLIDIRLTQLLPFDLIGYPKIKDTSAEYVALESFPTGNKELGINPKTGDPYKGFLLFLDEFNQADKHVLGAAYKLILDRMVGDHKLHPNTRIVCAGNLITDGAMANNLTSAIKSRLTHINLSFNTKTFLKWAEEQSYSNDFDSKVLAFLNFSKESICDFDPKSKDITYASPRTWEFCSKEIQHGLLNTDKSVIEAAILGTVGLKAGTNFLAFLDVYAELPSLDAILKNPEKCPIPEKIGALWALAGFLSSEVNNSNLNEIITYVNRFTQGDIKIITLRLLKKKCPQVEEDSRVRKIAVDVFNKIF